MIYLDAEPHVSAQGTHRPGSGHQRDKCFVVLGEFSEVHGPLALRVVPDVKDSSVKEQINNFVVQVMAVDYTGTHAGVPTYSPADTSMVYQVTKGRISAFVHYFNLHDIFARGYSRVFTLSFITLSSEFLLSHITTIKSSFEAMARVCHLENRLTFHQEMKDKRVQFESDVIECRQINWWLKEMERLYRLSPALPTPCTGPGARDDADVYTRISEQARRRWRSLPDLGKLDSKYMIKTSVRSGRDTLRHIRQLCPFGHLYLKECMLQLVTSRGSSGTPRHAREDVASLKIGRYSLQFPCPLFHNKTNAPEIQESGVAANTKRSGSIFYFSNSSPETLDNSNHDNSNPDNPANNSYEELGECAVTDELDKGPEYCSNFGYDIVDDPTLDSSFSADDPQFIAQYITPHSEHHSPSGEGKRVKRKGEGGRGRMERPRFDSWNAAEETLGRIEMISCISPKEIRFDLLKLRKILRFSSRDCIFSVLSGRPVVIVGEDDISSSFKNALSLFVTCPARVCPTLKSKLTLDDLMKYTLLQCKKEAAKSADCFAQSGLCSIIRHDGRCGKAPRYKGQLLSKIWGIEDRGVLSNYSESTLYSVVQSGLVSDLGTELLVKYYSLLQDNECALDAVFENGPDFACDTQIFRYQILLLLNPDLELLSSSHNINLHFKF